MRTESAICQRGKMDQKSDVIIEQKDHKQALGYCQLTINLIKYGDFLSMECTEASSTDSILTKRSVFDCLSYKSNEFSLGFLMKLITFLQKSSSIRFLTRLLSWD